LSREARTSSPYSQREKGEDSFSLSQGDQVKKLVVSIFAFVLMSSTLRAEMFSLSFFQNMTDNVFQNRYLEKDQLSSLNFYLDKDFSDISLFTEGNYVYLHENSGFSYYFHGVGLDYLHPANEKSAFYFALVGQGAFYRTDYDDFNYLSLNFLGSFKTYLSPTSILKSNYALEYKVYEYSLYDFISHFLDVSFDSYFQTRTTIKAELNWGYKNYLRSFPQTEEDQAIQILAIKGLLAQGIGGRVGLNVSGTKQWTLSGGNPFSSVEEFYMVENPSYDMYSWQGYQISSELTILVPWNIELKMGYTRSEKEFPGIESMDLEGNPLGVIRQDTRAQFEARVEKNFPEFSLFFSYIYIDNHSNDSFFDWQGNFLTVGLEWNVFFGGKK
jgi:hypothetical protein